MIFRRPVTWLGKGKAAGQGEASEPQKIASPLLAKFDGSEEMVLGDLHQLTPLGWSDLLQVRIPFEIGVERATLELERSRGCREVAKSRPECGLDLFDGVFPRPANAFRARRARHMILCFALAGGAPVSLVRRVHTCSIWASRRGRSLALPTWLTPFLGVACVTMCG